MGGGRQAHRPPSGRGIGRTFSSRERAAAIDMASACAECANPVDRAERKERGECDGEDR